MLKDKAKSFLRQSLGIDIVRVRVPPLIPSYQKNLLYEADAFFNQLYDRGMATSDTPDGGLKRRERFYNLMQFFSQTLSLDGLVVECGCWKGLSSFMMCNYVLRHRPDFRGEEYHIFDSFEGLSPPTELDIIVDKAAAQDRRKFGQPSGTYAASLDDVQQVLSGFPEITYHRGWIPQSFQDIPEAQYKFVHIDVDLYEPTRASVEYFYPQLIMGGIIICDDYGSLYWPGAKQAIDEYCSQNNLPLLVVSTGQAIIWKR
jgi:hypothetical protein